MDGVHADIADFHGANFSEIHSNDQPTDVFLAWHRQAAYELEHEMRDQTGDEWINLAYWDWTTSNSSEDPLWYADWLGPFDIGWNLGWELTVLPLPTQTEVDAALANADFYDFSRYSIEESSIHNNPHDWIGGVMSMQNSPKDPVFFFHHNMIDKIWADWYELHGDENTDYYVKTDMPRYDGNYQRPDGITLPSVNPDDIVNPRNLGVFYAENGLAKLDKYTVSNTNVPSEKFGYQFTIEAGEDFFIPSGKQAEFKSCEKIVLKPGFQASNGANFSASINSSCNSGNLAKTNANTTTKTKKPATPFQEAENKADYQFTCFPNPTTQAATLAYHLHQDSPVTLVIYDLTGRRILQLLQKQQQLKGMQQVTFDTQRVAAGTYFAQLLVGKDIRTIKLEILK